MVTDNMRKFPYLARFIAESQFPEVIVLMLETHHGYVLYIPTDLSGEDPRYELSFGQTLAPSNAEIEEFPGTLTLSNLADPVITEEES